MSAPNPHSDSEFLLRHSLEELHDMRRRTRQSAQNIKDFLRKIDDAIEKKTMEGQPTLFEESDRS